MQYLGHINKVSIVCLKFDLPRYLVFNLATLSHCFLQSAFQPVEEKETGKGSSLRVIKTKLEPGSHSRSCILTQCPSDLYEHYCSRSNELECYSPK